MPQSPAFRQVVIPPDQLDQMAHLQADDGWPLHWEIIPELPLAELQVSHAALTRDLGISFDQRIDLEDGLGNRPRAILVLPSGFRVALLLYPIESPEYDRYVMVEADPTSVNRPFVAGPFGEYILERYQTELIDEVLAALQLPTTCVEWRQRPFFDPPLSTEEGLRAFAQHYAACRPRTTPSAHPSTSVPSAPPSPPSMASPAPSSVTGSPAVASPTPSQTIPPSSGGTKSPSPVKPASGASGKTRSGVMMTPPSPKGRRDAVAGGRFLWPPAQTAR